MLYPQAQLQQALLSSLTGNTGIAQIAAQHQLQQQLQQQLILSEPTHTQTHTHTHTHRQTHIHKHRAGGLFSVCVCHVSSPAYTIGDKDLAGSNSQLSNNLLSAALLGNTGGTPTGPGGIPVSSSPAPSLGNAGGMISSPGNSLDSPPPSTRSSSMSTEQLAEEAVKKRDTRLKKNRCVRASSPCVLKY